MINGRGCARVVQKLSAEKTDRSSRYGYDFRSADFVRMPMNSSTATSSEPLLSLINSKIIPATRLSLCLRAKRLLNTVITSFMIFLNQNLNTKCGNLESLGKLFLILIIREIIINFVYLACICFAHFKWIISNMYYCKKRYRVSSVD